MHFPQSDGMTPAAKQILNKIWRKETALSLRRTPDGILSKPHALSCYALKMLFLFFYFKQRNVLIKKETNRQIALIIIGSYMQILKVYIIGIKKRAKIGFPLI